MKFTELGFDYSNLTSCTVRRKNFILALVFFILVICFLPIFFIFLGIYLAKAPMEINGVYVNYGDPAYQSFFVTFLSTFGLLSLVFLVIGFMNIFGKPKTYFIMNLNSMTLEPFYYIFNRRKHEEIYLTEQKAYIFNTRYNKLFEEHNPNAIRELLQKFIFWKEFETIHDYKVAHKKNKTTLKYTTNKSEQSRVRLRKVYSFSNNINVVPVSVIESISYASYGNRNNQNYYKYYFEDINRKQILDIHPEIKRKLTLLD